MPSLRPSGRLLALLVASFAVFAVSLRAAHAAPGAALFKYLPDDVEVVGAVNFAKSRSTPLFKKGIELASSQLADEWAKLKAAKLDPAKDIDTALVGAKTVDGAVRFAVIMEGRLAGFEAEVRKLPATPQQGVDLWTFGETSMFFVDKKLVICSQELAAQLAETAKGKRGNLKASKKAKTLRSAVAATDLRGDVWFATSSKELGSAMPVDGGSLSWMSMSMATSKGVAAELKAATDSEKTAASVLTLWNEQGGMVKQLMSSQGFGAAADSIEVKNTGSVVGMSLVLTDGELAKVLSYLSRQAGGAADVKSP